MTDSLLARTLVPVASESDAEATVDAVLPRVAADDGCITAIVVVEKAGGAPDKASVEQRELAAEDALAVVAERGADAGVPVDTDIVYGTDVVAAILDAADEADATAIAFTPRSGGGLLVDLLTGDVARRLVEDSDRPVVSFPAVDDDANLATGADSTDDADTAADADSTDDADTAADADSTDDGGEG